MRTQKLGSSDLEVTVVGYGCMLLGGSWGDARLTDSALTSGIRALEAAVEVGINFYDHADIYCQGKSEEVFAELLRTRPHLRNRLIVQSKCGIVLPGQSGNKFGYYDFSRKHILRAVEGSLRRLQTDRLDVLLLHRPDPLIEPEEVAGAFDELAEKGKVRYFGVSNHTAGQIALLQRHVRQPLVVNQVELNIVHNGFIDEGVVMNRERASQYGSGATLEYCRQHDITIQAYGPLAQGLLCGRALSDAEDPTGRFMAAAREVAALAQEKEVSAEAICLAWLLRHPAKIQPILGSVRAPRIIDACRGAALELSRQEFNRLYIAGRGAPLP